MIGRKVSAASASRDTRMPAIPSTPRSHFCDGKARRSGLSASMSSRKAPTPWALSSTVVIPAARAAASSGATGRTRPLIHETRERSSNFVGATSNGSTLARISSSLSGSPTALQSESVWMTTPVRSASAPRLPRIAGYSSSKVMMRSPARHSMPRIGRRTNSDVLWPIATRSRSVASTPAKTPRSSLARSSTSSMAYFVARPVWSSWLCTSRIAASTSAGTGP